MPNGRSATVPNRTTLALQWGLLLGAMAGVAVFVLSSFKNIFHSDAALKSVIADMALREGRGLPNDWVFANGDIFSLSPYVFVLPLSLVERMSFEANAAAVLIAYGCMIVAAWICAHTVLGTPQRSAALAATALIASTLSAANLEFVVSQGAYSVYAGAVLLLLALLALPQRTRWIAIGAFVLAFALVLSNPKRVLIQVLAPTLIALAAVAWREPGEGRLRRALRALRNSTVISMLAGSVLGGAVYYLAIAPNIANYDAAANVALATPASIKHALGQLPGDWYGYFQIDRAWAELTPWMRVLQLGVWAITTLTLIAPGWVILFGSDNPRLKFLAWASYGLLGAGLVPLVLTQGLYWSMFEIRYAILGTMSGFVVLAGALGEAALKSRRSAFKAASLPMLSLVALLTAWHWPGMYSPQQPDGRGISLNDRLALIDLLESKHVGSGVATYWNSHVLSVLSSGQVMIYPVTYGERLAPFPHHNAFDPRDGDAGAREAVILTKSEFESDQGRALERQLGKPAERVVSGPYVVAIYDGPIADRVFAVGHRFDRAVDPKQVAIDLGDGAVPACAASEQRCVVQFAVSNTGRTALASAGRNPMRIGLRGIDGKGDIVVSDLGRIDFNTVLAPGRSESVQTTLPKLPPEVVEIRGCLLQDGVSWLCERTSAKKGGAAPVLDGPVASEDVGVGLSRLTLADCADTSAQNCDTHLRVTNTGRYALSDAGSMPLRLGVRGFTANAPDDAIGTDAARIELGRDLRPGETIELDVPRPTLNGVVRYQICLLQENVSWHCPRTSLQTDARAP